MSLTSKFSEGLLHTTTCLLHAGGRVNLEFCFYISFHHVGQDAVSKSQHAINTKRWLAQVASEQLDEMQDPEFSIDRALQRYLNLGYSENWINQRLTSIEIRNELTNQSQQANSEMGEMGKAALQKGKRKMANEKVQDKSNFFPPLGIGSSVAHYYIRD